MKSGTLRLLFLQGSKFLLLVVLPFAAVAAEQQIQQQSSLASIALLTWFFLWLFSTGGWAIMHLDTLVEWFSDRRQELSFEERKALWKSRLTIIKNYVASLSAGAAFFLGASTVPSWFGMTLQLPEAILLIGTVPAAMGGTATWDKIKTKFGL